MASARQESESTRPIPEHQVGPGWFIGIVLLLAVMAGVFAFNQFNAVDASDHAAVHQPRQ